MDFSEEIMVLEKDEPLIDRRFANIFGVTSNIEINLSDVKEAYIKISRKKVSNHIVKRRVVSNSYIFLKNMKRMCE